MRDYIDVLDLIDWHLMSYSSITSWFNVYNLGTWKGISVMELLKKSEEIIWKKIKYNIVDRRNWDLSEVYCNPTKAFKDLWWKTKISLSESLNNSWKFYNK